MPARQYGLAEYADRALATDRLCSIAAEKIQLLFMRVIVSLCRPGIALSYLDTSAAASEDACTWELATQQDCPLQPQCQLHTLSAALSISASGLHSAVRTNVRDVIRLQNSLQVARQLFQYRLKEAF